MKLENVEAYIEELERQYRRQNHEIGHLRNGIVGVIEMLELKGMSPDEAAQKLRSVLMKYDF